MKSLPDHIIKPGYYKTGKPSNKNYQVLNETMIENLRKTCRIAKEILDITCDAAKPGITTEELDDIAHEACVKRNVYPSPLNYKGFPKSICTSVNHVVCHGIPGAQVLKDGDIINCDITVFANGVHGDCSRTVMIGEVPKNIKNLVEFTELAMLEGIKAIRPNGCVSSIGKAIERFVKDKSIFSIVREFGGHGIGEGFHMQPTVLHYFQKDYKFILSPGTALTVEPMINMGTRHIKLLDDGWTAVTADGSPSAQFEHTILITTDGIEILTA